MARKIQKKKALNKKLKTVLWFLIKFNLLAIPLYMVLFFNLSLPAMQSFLAVLSSKTISVFGYQVMRDGFFLTTQVNNQIQSIEISWDSTGWKSMYALVALVLATPISNLNKKIKFIALAVPTVFLINYLRIVSTILISLKFGWQYFDVIHIFLWREGLIFAVVAIWYVWLRRYKNI